MEEGCGSDAALLGCGGVGTHDPATTVGALLHFRFHLLSRSASSCGPLSGLARPRVERRRIESRWVRKYG